MDEVISADVLDWARDLRVIRDVLAPRLPVGRALQARAPARDGLVVSLTAVPGRPITAAPAEDVLTRLPPPILASERRPYR